MTDNVIKLSERQRAQAESFDVLPDSAEVDVAVLAFVKGVHPATIWRRVEKKELPEPVRHGPRCTRWKMGDLRKAANDAETKAA